MDAQSLALVYKEKFQKNIPFTLGESKGGKLAPYCINDSGTPKETFYFNLEEGYSTDDTAPQMYNNDGYTGTSGSRKRIECKPTSVYAHDMYKFDEINKGMFRPDHNYMKGFRNALENRDDLEIIKALEAHSAKIINVGFTVGEELNSPGNLVKFRLGCALALAQVDDDVVIDGATSTVAVGMNNTDFANLVVGGEDANKVNVASVDFQQVTQRNGILSNNLFGCAILRYKNFVNKAKWGNRTSIIPGGTCYWIPRGTMGRVVWKEGFESLAKRMQLNGDVMAFWVKKSVGACAIQPEYILGGKFKASTITRGLN